MLSESLHHEILTHMYVELPREGCGLLAGTFEGGLRRATRFFVGTNIDASETRFTMEPAEVINAFRSMRETDEELVAIVHSHPTSLPVPSPTDRDEAYYPEALMLIVSFQQSAEMRAWASDLETDGRIFQDIPIVIVPDHSGYHRPSILYDSWLTQRSRQWSDWLRQRSRRWSVWFR